MEFSRVIKDIRIKALLSQAAYAKEIGVSFSTVNRWEKGKAKPRYDALKRIKVFCEKNKIQFEVDEQYLAQ
ncbi:MAG: helix-turn-helix transcriptional regulator [Clostridiaceae bacterium]|nr:helix-turn-helix transcriptional regulator [Clostridiaceae bacterium]